MKNVSSSIVEITWDVPTNPNGILLGYKLSYKKKADQDYTNKHLDSDILAVNITSLGM